MNLKSTEKVLILQLSIFILTAFVITLTFKSLTDNLGTAGTFWLFSGLSILGTVFVFFIIPETKGKTLNEIQKMLSGGKPTTDEEEEGEK